MTLSLNDCLKQTKEYVWPTVRTESRLALHRSFDNACERQAMLSYSLMLLCVILEMTTVTTKNDLIPSHMPIHLYAVICSFWWTLKLPLIGLSQENKWNIDRLAFFAVVVQGISVVIALGLVSRNAMLGLLLYFFFLTMNELDTLHRHFQRRCFLDESEVLPSMSFFLPKISAPINVPKGS